MKFRQMCFTGVVLSLLGMNVMAENNFLSYKNTRGSILKLQINPDNSVTGFFTSAVASKECQKAIGMQRPITGYIEKNALAFSVNYPGCGVVTFIGNIEDNQKTIDTTAMITHTADSSSKEGMKARMITHDVFSRMASDH